jgi:hypothetical protein
MTDYYISAEITQHPYSVILSDAQLSWRTRLEVVFRKALGWHFLATHGRAPATTETVVALEQQPAEVRAGITSAIDELRQYGFNFVAINKGKSIGACIAYSGMFVDDERTTVWSVLAMRRAVNAAVVTGWGMGLRSDLKDGTSLITGRNVDRIPSYWLPNHFRFEAFPESTPTAEIAQRHFDRLRAIPNAEIVRIRSEETVEYLLKRSRDDFQAYIDTGFYRKLTEAEVARLRDVHFEFI